ncbi:PREDICTED: uncharacterized protein LOC106817699 [Priapulus caudatus]|uniref:Uncharacterized protein LOC106817699 n=1 Tax=Priapulus caudatus TaxID=37621 RepID=A0ABM1F0A8_PRICU|nr:PREDICTED: uncharacterized protein LOC106817699 [Priapulus caudatus]
MADENVTAAGDCQANLDEGETKLEATLQTESEARPVTPEIKLTEPEEILLEPGVRPVTPEIKLTEPEESLLESDDSLTTRDIIPPEPETDRAEAEPSETKPEEIGTNPESSATSPQASQTEPEESRTESEPVPPSRVGRRVAVVAAVVVAIIAALWQVEAPEDRTPLVDKSVVLSLSQPHLFSLVSDLERVPQWFPEVLDVDEVDTSPIKAGKQYNVVFTTPVGWEHHVTVALLSFSPPDSLTLSTDSAVLPATVEFRVQQLPAGTGGAERARLTVRLFSDHRSYLFKMLGRPAMRFVSGNMVRNALFRLMLNSG